MALDPGVDDDDVGAPGWRRNNYAAMLCMFLLTASFSFTIPFLPLYLRQIDGLSGPQSSLWAGVATGLGGVGSFVTGPLWGVLGDRYGRKLMLVRASFGGATGLLLFGFATSTWQVVAIRTFIGVMAGAPAAAMALMAASTPRSLLPRALGHFQAASLSGLALGPVVAASFISWLGYRHTFMLTAVLMFAGATVSAVMIKEYGVPASEPTEGITPPAPHALRVVLRSRLVWAALGLVLCLSFASPMVQPILGPFVGTLLPDGASTNATVGWLFFGISAAGAVSAVSCGRFIRRFGLQPVLVVACVGVAAFLIPSGSVHSVGALAALIVTMSFFSGALQTSAVALLPSVVGAASVSSIFGLYQSVQALSAQLGPSLGGALAVWVGFRGVFPIAGTALLVLGLPMFWVFRRVARSVAAENSRLVSPTAAPDGSPALGSS
jgi:DHA1 family multidrug resistance protein-like MFS transporter